MSRTYQLETGSGSVVFQGSYTECVKRHDELERSTRSYAYIREASSDSADGVENS